MPVIKRYPNRKLYNTETKQYITLDELADLIRHGEDIHVIDYATGEDMTALTMTQILFEQVKNQAGFLPRAVLSGLIRAGGNRMSAFQRILMNSLGLKHETDEEIRRRIQALVTAGELSEDQGRELTEKLLLQGGEPSPEEIQETEVVTREELQKLLDEIESLNAKLDGLE